MKNKKINIVIPYLLEDTLVLSLSSGWITICGGIPPFEVKIDKDNRLHLIGPVISHSKSQR